MGVGVGILLPVVLWGLALVIAKRELGLYREHAEFGTDLFAYSKWRLARRLTGVLVMIALGATLMAYELAPASSPRGASIYLGVLVGEVLALVVLPVLDLWETVHTADPEDLTRQADPDRRTRTKPRRPR